MEDRRRRPKGSKRIGTILIAASVMVRRRMLLKRILVPVDFSKDSLNAVTYAAECTQPFGKADAK